VGIIEKGQLIENDDVAQVMRKVRQQPVLRIDVAGDREKAAKALEQFDGVELVELKPDGLRVTLSPGPHDYSQVAKLLVEQGHGLTRLTEEEIDLETAFMTLTKGITS
jgi:ABC-2 type transport system ATP-binding protein